MYNRIMMIIGCNRKMVILSMRIVSNRRQSSVVLTKAQQCICVNIVIWMILLSHIWPIYIVHTLPCINPKMEYQKSNLCRCGWFHSIFRTRNVSYPEYCAVFHKMCTVYQMWMLNKLQHQFTLAEFMASSWNVLQKEEHTQMGASKTNTECYKPKNAQQKYQLRPCNIALHVLCVQLQTKKLIG